MLKRDEDAPTRECRSCPLDGACDTIRWPNLPFHCVLRSSIVFSFLWGNKWQWMIGGLSLTIVFFLFFFFLFFRKKCTSVIFSLGFSISIPMFFIAFFFVFGSFIKVFYVFNLVLKLQFVIYYFFQFDPYSFDFWFFPWLFC